VQEEGVGKTSPVRVLILHLQPVAPPALVEEIRARIRSASADTVTDSTQLAELISGRYWTPFPLHLATERPDRVIAALLQGKVVLVVDGSPWALLLPVQVRDFFFTTDDYSLRPPVTLLLRLTRVLAWVGIVVLPGMYIALEAYNPDVLRADLMLSIAASRAGVPFNVIFELLFLVVMVELVQETAIRLPQKVGQATTIVGALIIGEAVARAHVVSNIAIVIAAMGSLGSLTFPDREIAAAWRLSSGVVVLGGALFGVYGVLCALMLILLHLNALDSFGVPYLSPLAPFDGWEWLRDGITRLPWWCADRWRTAPISRRSGQTRP